MLLTIIQHPFILFFDNNLKFMILIETYPDGEKISMPIYEFYCSDCHTIFNFFSRTVNTTKKPTCPKCKKKKLSRQVSIFSFTGNASEDGGLEGLPMDEGKIERAMQALAGEADKINEDDPRQAADLMRKLTDMTGLKMGPGMDEALARMEKGDDPEQIESEMGDLLQQEDILSLPGKKGKSVKKELPAPFKDETLYDL